MTYTAREVRTMAADLRDAPGTSMIWTHISMPVEKAKAMYDALVQHADMLERQAAGVTDEVVRRFVAAYMAAVGPGPILNFDAIKSALLAAQAVAAEPVAQQAARVDEAMVERACAAYERAEDRAYYGVRKRFMRAALEAALSAQPAERQGELEAYSCALAKPGESRSACARWCGDANRCISTLEDDLAGEIVKGSGSLGDINIIRWQHGYTPEVGAKLYTQPAAPVTDERQGEDYEVRRGSNNEWGIYLKGFNVRVATFAPGSVKDRERIAALLNHPAASVGVPEGNTLPIDVRGRWHDVPIAVHLHIIALRDRLEQLDADETLVAVYDAVGRSNLTRDVKTPETKARIVREVLAAAQPAPQEVE